MPSVGCTAGFLARIADVGELETFGRNPHSAWVALRSFFSAIFSPFGIAHGQGTSIIRSSLEGKSNNVDWSRQGRDHRGQTRARPAILLTYKPETTTGALDRPAAMAGVKFRGAAAERNSRCSCNLLISAYPTDFYALAYFMRQMQGASGGRGRQSFGKSRGAPRG